MNKKNLQKLFEKDMTRKEFLAHIGTALLLVIGVKSVLDHLSGNQEVSNNNGYGSSKYGG